MTILTAPTDYQPPADVLQGKTILVTGAGDGIGRAAAITYAQHGATVILLGRTGSKLEAVYDLIEAADGPKPALVEIDLATATEDNVIHLAAGLAEEFGHLDGLLHNAAELPLLSRIDDYDLEVWKKVLRVNLTAPFLLTQVCLPLLRQSPDASILFTSVKNPSAA